MNMKKLVALLLALVMVFALCACGGDKDNGGKDSATYKVAMITDYGDITDQSFNQTTYEACKAFCTENNIEFTYYKPAGDSTPDRIAMVEKAVDHHRHAGQVSGREVHRARRVRVRHQQLLL